MKLFLGIDIGGTKIACLAADEKGRVVKSDHFIIRHNQSPERNIQELIRRIRRLISKKKIEGIGIGTPGPVNPASGKIPWSPNLAGWEGIPISKIFKKAFHIPVFIENDANVAALCEMKFGSGRGKKDLIYITVSTGIGGGLILSGKLYSGHNFSGGELGHMTIIPDGNLCHCGKHGCIEAHASGTAIGDEAERVAGLYPGSLLGKIYEERGKLTSREVKEAAVKKDERAMAILKKAGRLLGAVVGNLINLLNPQMIVLGGGVMKGKGMEFLWNAMIESAKKESWPKPFRGCRIVRTKFRDDVGALGAVALAIQNEKCKM